MFRFRLLIPALLFGLTAHAAAPAPTAGAKAFPATPVKQPAAPVTTPLPPKPEPTVYVKRVKGEFAATYKNIFTALENNSYFVIFEPNIGKNLAHFAQRWGENYNRNRLEGIRSMVFCNGWYANEVSNKDPDMLALCPLHITLVHKQGVTTILFVRPGQVAKDSKARKVAEELEQDVIRVLEEAVGR
jgi:uncharacterized protein (DUF302 family)